MGELLYSSKLTNLRAGALKKRWDWVRAGYAGALVNRYKITIRINKKRPKMGRFCVDFKELLAAQITYKL